MPSSSEFRKSKSHEERKLEIERVRTKHPDRIGIVVEKSKTCQDLNISKSKYLAPLNMDVNGFISVLKKNIKSYMGDEKEPIIYLYINNVILDTDASLKFLYEKNAHTDGYLYIKYSDKYDYGKKTSTLLNAINPWGTSVVEKNKSNKSDVSDVSNVSDTQDISLKVTER